MTDPDPGGPETRILGIRIHNTAIVIYVLYATILYYGTTYSTGQTLIRILENQKVNAST
jgi:hypothetical protein